tara:strand:- start:412 stop:720 length:309 start_codon:yes stop_codon:yes gene_type:complete
MSEPTSCPRCQSTKVFDRGRKYQVYPLGCLAILGFSLAIFHQGQLPHRLECQECGAVFNRRSKLAMVNLICFWLIAGTVLALLAALLVLMVWALAVTLIGRI